MRLYSTRQVIRPGAVAQLHRVLRQRRRGVRALNLRIPRPGWRPSMALIDFAQQPHDNPLEVVEQVASTNGWSFQRAGEDEITIFAAGKWTDYQVSYTWMFDIEALHLACAFELKVPERCRGEVQQLISMINEQMWVGHFDLWTQDGLVMYRHALVLTGGVEASGRQCEALLATALEACERYFPAFQFVVWAGKPARVALDAAMFDTQGQAEPHLVKPGRRHPHCQACHVRRAVPHSEAADRDCCPRNAMKSPQTAHTCLRRSVGMTERGMSTPSTLELRPLASLSHTILLAGVGKMGGALLQGWLALGLSPEKVAVIEPLPS